MKVDIGTASTGTWGEADLRPSRIKDEVTLFDHYGQVLFKVDRWIYEVALERGDLARWFAK